MIQLKSDSEIDAMKKSCQLAAKTLDMIEEFIKPGISTQKLDDICVEFISKNGAISAPLNYRGFPRSICTSVNEVICHGIPNPNHILEEGDIINVDVTTILDGYHGDTSRTFYVGDKISMTARRITECAKASMIEGIKAVKAGGHIGDIGAAIQSFAEGQNFSVVKEFVGHGIGSIFHEDPQIPHYGSKGSGGKLKPGMVFTIEPMINEGDWRSKILRDGWTAVTIDGGLSAQFEHTLAIRSDGEVEILTVSENSVKLN